MTQPLSSPTVPIRKVQKLEDFCRLFQDRPSVYKYQDRIKNIISKSGNTLIIDYEDLLAFDPQIAELLKNDPESLLKDAIEAFENLLKFESGGKLIKQKYFVRITTKDENSPLFIPIRGLRSKNIDNLVWFKGILIRISTIRPKLIRAFFECNLCGTQFEIIQLTSKIRWPKFCINKRCKAKAQSDFRLLSKNSDFIDWQGITIQEIPEDLPPGRIPRSVQAILTYDLVDIVKPGDRIKVMGIFKSILAQSIKNYNSTLFKTYVDVNFIDPEDKSEDFIDLSKEDIEKIEKLSKEPMIQKKIARSIAPTIYGRENLKMACALSIFAGRRKKTSGRGFKRGDIHVLFVGDPGTGKSISGLENVYIGTDTLRGIEWTVREIGDFVDELIDENIIDVISRGETEIIKLSNNSPKYTFSINPYTLKTQETKIKEVSRHKANTLIQIKTESGRFIVATLDHSFTTLIDGELQIIDANTLSIYHQKNQLYLPVARNLNFGDSLDNIDISTFFNEEELVSTNMIREQISLFRSGRITLRQAAEASNITQGTLLSYEKKPYSIPNGDWIRRKHDNNWFSRIINLNGEFGRIVGFYIAEGDNPKNSGRISNTNEEVIKLIENDIVSIFGRGATYDDYDFVQIHQASLAHWFHTSFGRLAQNKKFHSIFFSSPLTFRRSLLSAYFTEDSYIEREKLYIKAITASKKLAYLISDMLSTFGIFGTIKPRVFKSGRYRGNIYYKIILTGEEVIKFYQQIGFLSTEKQQRLEEAIFLASSRTRNQAKDIIPNFGDILQRISTDLGLKNIRGSWERDFLADIRDKTQRQRAGRLYLKKKVEQFEDLYNQKHKLFNDDLIWLKTLTESDIFWDKIEEINVISENTFVYDIGTDDGHFIVANGNLIVHNSEILKSAVEVSPRGLYTSGKGSTAVGLTAAVIKDPDTGQMNLEAGAIVLANGGIAAIDEFDKMDTADRSALHEAMAQQTVSIAKAGIVATLKAETAIIAAANPHSGRYNPYKTPTQNIRLPPSLLSRFDLIFVVVDKPDRAHDAQMAEFILNNAMKDSIENVEEKENEFAPISIDLLKKYIKHAKRVCHPVLTEEAKERIKEFYLKLRGDYDSEDAIVSILARNLDALVRLSEAHTKMALRNKVTKEDVEEIIKIFKIYLKDIGYDETTGKIDMDRIFMGESRSKINKLTQLMDRLKELFEENDWKALEKKNVIQILELEENLDKRFIKNALEEAIKEGTLYEPKNNLIKFTRRDE
jgi:replicative DNA helicase Mcm